MAKQDIQTIIGSSISKDETLLKNFKSIKSCFVGWVESYNATSGTVNVQPAIQDFIPNDEQSGKNYRNSPLLVNVWVLGTFKSTAIEKGDKAVCFVLDQKSNDFFKCIYDSGLSLGFQTFKPKTSAQKSVCDCVCVILGDASFQEIYNAVSAIDIDLSNKADIDGTYPDMTVGNATNADSATKATQDEDGNNIPNTYAKQTGTYPDMTVGNASQLGGVDAASYAQLSQVLRIDVWQDISKSGKRAVASNVYKPYNYGYYNGWIKCIDILGAYYAGGDSEAVFAIHQGNNPWSYGLLRVYFYTGGNSLSSISLKYVGIDSNSGGLTPEDIRGVYNSETKHLFIYIKGKSTFNSIGVQLISNLGTDIFDSMNLPFENSTEPTDYISCQWGDIYAGEVTKNGAPVLAIDPTKLTPSTDNGWSGGTSSSIPSTAGAYWVKVDNQPITLIAYYVGGDWVSGTTIWYKQA